MEKRELPLMRRELMNKLEQRKGKKRKKKKQPGAYYTVKSVIKPAFQTDQPEILKHRNTRNLSEDEKKEHPELLNMWADSTHKLVHCLHNIEQLTLLRLEFPL